LVLALALALASGFGFGLALLKEPTVVVRVAGKAALRERPKVLMLRASPIV
jgi:hypothetical protein